MARYRVFIKASAAREVERVAKLQDRRRIVERIRALGNAPRPPGAEKLAGHADRFRVRQGDYRIVYAVSDREQLVEVVKVGHRRDVYR